MFRLHHWISQLRITKREVALVCAVLMCISTGLLAFHNCPSDIRGLGSKTGQSHLSVCLLCAGISAAYPALVAPAPAPLLTARAQILDRPLAIAFVPVLANRIRPPPFSS